MTQQLSIAARDHGTRIAQQRLDGVAGCRCLPFVPCKRAGLQDNPRDFLLGGACPLTIEGPQHASQPCTLLSCQPRIGRDRTPMERREEPLNGLDPVETIESERDDRNRDHAAAGRTVENLNGLAVAELKAKLRIGTVCRRVGSPARRNAAKPITELRRRVHEQYDAGVFLRKPEDRSIWRVCQGIDREIATPIAAECARSAVRGLHAQRPKLQSRRHRLHCGATTPTPDRMPSIHPVARSLPKSARSMRQGSSRPPEAFPEDCEGSGFPCGLRYGSQVSLNR